MVKETWPDWNPGLFIDVVRTLLSIHGEGGYDDAKTLEVLIQQYQTLIGPLPDTQGSK